MNRNRSVISLVAIILIAISAPALAVGDPEKGAQVFGACASCHSLVPGQHLTGPSLANVLGRKAGTVEGFVRNSDALKKSGVLWDEKSLDAWLQNPAALVPNNFMAFPGLSDPQARQHLIAFLKDPSTKRPASAPGGMVGGMMGNPQLVGLKQLPPEDQIKAIRYCRDSYFLTTVSGQTIPFWEFNLRFKTDSSANGPAKGEPVLVGSGMRGDRSFVVFSSPAEISRFIELRC